MIKTSLFWLFLNLFLVSINGFYSMVEMACVSMNRVRLHYWVSKKNKQALWLNWLLQHPFRLFGTTLVCVNIATFASSECAREFHQTLGIDPDWAPLSQVLLLIILGELAPMFAARVYPEHVALLGAPLLYATSQLMAPILWIIGIISKLINRLIGAKDKDPHFFLNQEELEKVLEARGDEAYSSTEDINLMTKNILHLRNKSAQQIMTPIKELPLLDSYATFELAQSLFSRTDVSALGIYHKTKWNIVGIINPRNLIRAHGQKKIREFSQAPWFITETTSALSLLQQFRHNKESVATVVNQQGQAVGMIYLDDLVKEIFGQEKINKTPLKNRFILERTCSGEMTLDQVKEQFGVELGSDGQTTLSELLTDHLGRHPEEGESIFLGDFEIMAKECGLLDVKTVVIKTRG
jgi:CBS domain containing-hemolysin-like protein